MESKELPKKGTKTANNKDGKKDGGVLSLLGKKKSKPARQKKAQELKRQSRLPTKGSSTVGRRYGSVDSSPTSPPWFSGRTSVGSCPNSPMMSGYEGPKGNVMSKSAFEAFWNGPEPLFDPTQGPKEYRKERSPEEENGPVAFHLKPGGSPEVHRIQLRVDTKSNPPNRPPPIYQNTAQLRSPPQKPKHSADHKCSSHSSSGEEHYNFPSPGVSPEIQRSNNVSDTAKHVSQEIAADAPKVTSTSILPEHYKYLSDYRYNEPPPKPKHTMPQQFIIQEGTYSESVTEKGRLTVQHQQYVTPDEIYSKGIPEKRCSQSSAQSDKICDEGRDNYIPQSNASDSSDKRSCDVIHQHYEYIYPRTSPKARRHKGKSHQSASEEVMYYQTSPDKGHRGVMYSSSHSSPESPRAKLIRASEHIGSHSVRKQHSFPTPGNSPEIQRILLSCPPPVESPSPPMQRAHSVMDERIYSTSGKFFINFDYRICLSFY